MWQPGTRAEDSEACYRPPCRSRLSFLTRSPASTAVILLDLPAFLATDRCRRTRPKHHGGQHREDQGTHRDSFERENFFRIDSTIVGGGGLTPAKDRRLIMQHKHLQFGHGFRIVLGDEHSQAAQMTLAPREPEGGPDNRHRGADQWLYVVSGTGVAILGGERVELRDGTLVLIQRGDTHEIRITGDGPL